MNVTEQSVINAQLNAAIESGIAAREQRRPFVLLRPDVFLDGNQWCALYGENLQMGVAGFGNTPDEASRAFDDEWHQRKSTSQEQS